MLVKSISARLNNKSNFIKFRLTKREKECKVFYLTPSRVKRLNINKVIN